MLFHIFHQKQVSGLKSPGAYFLRRSIRKRSGRSSERKQRRTQPSNYCYNPFLQAFLVAAQLLILSNILAGDALYPLCGYQMRELILATALRLQLYIIPKVEIAYHPFFVIPNKKIYNVNMHLLHTVFLFEYGRNYFPIDLRFIDYYINSALILLPAYIIDAKVCMAGWINGQVDGWMFVASSSKNY